MKSPRCGSTEAVEIATRSDCVCTRPAGVAAQAVWSVRKVRFVPVARRVTVANEELFASTGLTPDLAAALGSVLLKHRI
jgi:hypothetical protein